MVRPDPQRPLGGALKERDLRMLAAPKRLISDRKNYKNQL